MNHSVLSKAFLLYTNHTAFCKKSSEIVNKSLKAVFSLFLFLLISNVSAQYTGGIGSGYDMSEMLCSVPTPVISSNSPVCDNASLFLEAIGEGDIDYPAEATYEWTGPGGWTSADPLPERTPAVAGDYFLIVSIPGCGESIQSSHTVETLESPTVFLVPESDTEFCEGEEVVFQAIPDFPAYQWYKDDVEITGEEEATFVATESGEYFVVATAENGCSSASTTEEVIVNNLPQVSITALGDTEFCDGGSVELEASASGAGTISYQWYEETIGIIDGETNSTFIAAESGLYYVEVTDENGCIQYSESIEIIILPLPDVAINPTDNVSFCADETVEVLFEATPGFETYQWYKDDIAIVDAIAETYLATEPGIYYVVVTDINGCENSSESTEIIVNELPEVFITYEGDASICEGESLLLTATTGYEEYEWYKDDVIIEGENSDTYSATEAGSYYVAVTDINGCSNFSETIDIIVNPIPEPVIFTEAESLDFCEGDDIEVLLELESNDFYASFQWYKDGVEIVDATDETYLATEAGEYFISVTDVNGCSGLSNTIEIIENPLPIVEITTDGIIEFCSQELIAIPDDYEWYEWTLNDAVVEGENEATLIARFSGEYVVWATDANQCVGLSEPLEVILPDRPIADAGEDQTIDYGTSTSLTAADGGDGNYTYSWEPAELFVDANVQNPTTVDLFETTEFTLRVFDTDSECDNFDQITVFVNPQMFTLNVDVDPVEGGSVEVMVDDVVLAEPYEIEVDKEVFLTAIAETDYEFLHFAVGSDEFTDNPYSFFITQNTDVTAVFDYINTIINAAVADITIYPNPARDLINIEWENADNVVSVNIVNASGQIVKTIEFTNTQGKISEQIDVSEWQRGMYFIRIAGDNGVITKNFVIQ